MSKLVINVKELAELLGCSPNTVYNLTSQKRIPFIKIRGIGLRFMLEDIENWLLEHEESGLR